MGKKGYIILAVSLVVASAAFYFYRKTRAFVPTQESAKHPIEIVFNP